VNKEMKAIVLTDHFGEGGAERVASLLIKGLADVGHEVHVCVFIDSNKYGVEMNRVVFHLLSPRQYPYMFNVLNRIKNLVKVIRDVRPNVIYSFGPIMASYVTIAVTLSGLRNHIKIVSSERNDPRKEPVSDIKKRIRDFCYKRSDIIVCQTLMAVNLLKGRGINTKFVIIPNPISPNLPTWDGLESKEIITAARLTEQKNLPLLINAFERIHQEFPSFRLTIYGEGELRPVLQNLIDQKKLASVITLPGFAENIHLIMSQSFMYVSSSDYEGISNSMLEALGIGLPCVCTDCPVGGAAMYIKDGVSGILTKTGDEEGLYLSMKRLISNPSIAISMSKESVKIREELTLDSIIDKWNNLIA
jgi:glycosyltransferase involved in cell wall biosynthesis